MNSGSFKKGERPVGRAKGTPNKNTTAIKDKVQNLIDHLGNSIQNDIKGLTPKERIDTYLKLLEYSVPKLSRLDSKENQGNEKESFQFTVRYVDPEESGKIE